MARIVANGEQDFEVLVKENSFYIDKTDFIREWWENRDSVTLIARPRRFGKTLTMNMVERFFSVKYKGQGELFHNLNIWKYEKYRQLQGTYPVIGLSFSDVKETTYEEARKLLCRAIYEQYDQYRFLLDIDGLMSEADKELFHAVSRNMENDVAIASLRALSKWLMNYYGKKVIILLDEYDTPMQEAYVQGYWDELVPLIRSLFHSTFKANPYLARAIMTGITRVSKESIFSDLNNLEVVTTTSEKYRESFGFMQEEVSDALGEFGLTDQEKLVKQWYDGFTFGGKTDIYNPWSITNFLEKKKLQTYWVNTSSNRLIGSLIRKGNVKVKIAMEELLKGNTIHANIDEQIIFSQLDDEDNNDAIWSLLLASGYLRVEHHTLPPETEEEEYDLKLTNHEVRLMFRKMIKGWFSKKAAYNDFIRALLKNNLSEMNDYMNDVAMATFSSFDTGTKPSKRSAPERFYHGFVLGLIVDLADLYEVKSNRESGLGRYDVMLNPKKEGYPVILMEFKVYDAKKEKTLQDTVKAALTQIEEKKYAADEFAKKEVREYGFAFEGKNVLIGGGTLLEVEKIRKG